MTVINTQCGGARSRIAKDDSADPTEAINTNESFRHDDVYEYGAFGMMRSCKKERKYWLGQEICS